MALKRNCTFHWNQRYRQIKVKGLYREQRRSTRIDQRVSSMEYAQHQIFESFRNVTSNVTNMSDVGNKVVNKIDGVIDSVKNAVADLRDKFTAFSKNDTIARDLYIFMSTLSAGIFHIFNSPTIRTVAISVGHILVHIGILGATAVNGVVNLIEKILGACSSVPTIVVDSSVKDGEPLPQQNERGESVIGDHQSNTVKDDTRPRPCFLLKKSEEWHKDNFCRPDAIQCAIRGCYEATHQMAGKGKQKEEQTPNLDTTDIPALAGIMWTGATTMAGVVSRNPQDVQEVARFMRDKFPRNAKDGTFVIRFLQAILDTVVKIFHMIKAIICPVRVKLEKVFSNNDFIKRWVEEVLILTSPLCWERIQTEPVWSDRVFFCSDTGSVLLSLLCQVDGLESKRYAPIRDLCTKIYKVRDKLHQCKISPTVFREPFCVWMFGEHGIGKSSMSDKLIKDMLDAADIHWTGERDLTINSGMTYANRATSSQPVWKFDDFMAVKSEAAKHFMLSAYFGLKTCAPYNPLMAGVEEKKILVSPELIFVGSNMGFISDEPQIADYNAFHRRRDLLVEARWNIRDYPDKSLLKVPISEYRKVKHLEFAIYKDSCDPSPSVMPNKSWVSYDLLIKYAKERFLEYRTIQLTLAQDRYFNTISQRAREECDDSLMSWVLKQSEKPDGQDFSQLLEHVKQIGNVAQHQMADEPTGAFATEKDIDQLVESNRAAGIVPHEPQPSTSNVASVPVVNAAFVNPNYRPIDKVVYPYCKNDKTKRCDVAVPGEDPNVDCNCVRVNATITQTIEQGGDMVEGFQRYIGTKCSHSAVYDFMAEGDEVIKKTFYSGLQFDQNLQMFYYKTPEMKGMTAVDKEKVVSTMKTVVDEGVMFSSIACSAKDGDPANCCFNDTDKLWRFHKWIRQARPDLYADGVCPKVLASWWSRIKFDAKNMWITIKDMYNGIVQWLDDTLPTWFMTGVRFVATAMKWVAVTAAIGGAALATLFGAGKLVHKLTGCDRVNGAYRVTTEYLSEKIPFMGKRATHNIVASSDARTLRATAEKKVVAKVIAHSAEHQSSAQNVSVLMNRIKDNTVTMVLKGEDVCRRARLLVLKGRTALVIRHYVEIMTSHEKEMEWYHYELVTPSATIPFKPNFEDVIWIENSDFGLLELPKSFPMRKSLIPFIASEAEHQKVSANKVLLEVVGTNTAVHYVDTTISTLTAHGERASTIKLDKVYRYGVSGPGLCGSVLIAKDRIYGVHVAGSNWGGYAEPLCRETYMPRLDKVEPYFVEELTPIELDRFPLNTSVFPVGMVPKEYVHHESGKSRIVPTEIHGTWPVRTAPAPLAVHDPRCGGKSPMFSGCEKHGILTKPFEKQLLVEVQEHLDKVFRQAMKPRRDKVGVLTIAEAVCGIAGDEYYQPLDLSTSEGFPFVYDRPKGGCNKRWLLDVEDVDNQRYYRGMHKKLEHIFSLKRSMRKQGIRPMTIWIDNLKDARLPLAKCIPGKTRIFSTSPVDYTIEFRRYFNDFIASYMAGRFRTYTAIGIACDGYEWGRLRSYLTPNDDFEVMGLDYKNFGPGLNEEVLWYFFQNMIKFYEFNGCEERFYQEMLMEETLNAYHQMFQYIYQVGAGLPSGCPGTAVLNSGVNTYYIMCIWLVIMQGTEYCCLRDFDDNVRLVTYGDDLIMSVHKRVLDKFNMVTIAEAFATYNIIVSHPSKDLEIDKPFIGWEDISFLKRKFAPHPYRRSEWLAPIDEMSVYECGMWCWQQDNLRLAGIVNADAACLLAYGHGKEFYKKFVEELEQAWLAIGEHYEARTWKAIDNLFFSDREYVTHQMNDEGERKDVVQEPCVTVDNISFPPEMFFGEQILQMKDCMRRYDLYAVLPKMEAQAPDTMLGMFKIAMRVEGLPILPEKDRYFNYARTSPRNLMGSGYVYFKGSLRCRLVVRTHDIVKIQHVFDSRPPKELTLRQIYTPSILSDYFQSGYATYVQCGLTNMILSFEIPYYLPSVMGVVGPGADNLSLHDQQYLSLGTLLIRIESMAGDAELWVAFADDASFHAFQGFPPMVGLEDEPSIPRAVTHHVAVHQMMNQDGAHGTSAPPPVVSSGNVCLEAGGEESVACPNIDMSVFRTITAQETRPILEFESILDRFVKIDTWDWTSKQIKNFQIFKIDLMEIVATKFERVSGGIPFQLFQYWSGDVILRFETNTNFCQRGQVQVSLGMLPSMRRIVGMQNTVELCSQRTHVLLNAGASGEAELCIPYSYPLPFLPLRGEAWGLGKYHSVYGLVLSKLQISSGTNTNCSISCFVAIRNSTFTGMIPQTEVGRHQMFPMSLVGAMAGLNMLMADKNRDKPPYFGAPSGMVPQNAQSFCLGTNVVEPINIMRLDARGQTPHVVVPEMSFEDVKRVWGMIKVVSIDTNTPIGTKLWDVESNLLWPVNRTNYPLVNSGTVEAGQRHMPTYCIPPCDVIQSMFGYGRGSWEIRVDVIASKFHQCRVQMVVVPGPAISFMDAALARASTNAVFTIDGPGQFVFTVPYISPQPMWPRRFVGGDLSVDFDSLGHVYLFLINKLVATQDVSSSIDLVLYKRAGIDYQYMCLAQPSLAPAWNREFAIGIDFKLKAKEGYYPWYVGVWHSWGGSKYAILRYGAGSDHIAQFISNRDGYIYELDWDDTNSGRPTVKYTETENNKPVEKSDDVSWVVPISLGGYVYAAPFKTRELASQYVKLTERLTPEQAYGRTGYKQVVDQGNAGLYPVALGNLLFEPHDTK